MHARVWVGKGVLFREVSSVQESPYDVRFHCNNAYTQFTTSTFQAVLITDGSASYAVFIYDCGGMEWDGAIIGWAKSSTLYEKHTLSGFSSDEIGCRYSSSYSAVIYRVDRTVGTYSKQLIFLNLSIISVQYTPLWGNRSYSYL